jgi:dipeptidyl aminopeptidase/acylaminoacyl peptidase
MGLQGHSWGGYQTNYIITQTSIFAAAVSFAGLSDFISGYNSIIVNGKSAQYSFELDQCRIGSTLWQNTNSYINNSPIFFANKIATPILLINNKGDGAVPFTQGVELFVALRRLNKKAWMLQYDGEDHSLQSDKASRDFTFRMFQYFDHYLKKMHPPKWMTKGIPAIKKGIDAGYELDSIGTCGEDCEVCHSKKR